MDQKRIGRFYRTAEERGGNDARRIGFGHRRHKQNHIAMGKWELYA